MCLHHVFSMNSDIDGLYMPRSQKGRGLCSVADVIKVIAKVLGYRWRNHQSHYYKQFMQRSEF